MEGSIPSLFYLCKGLKSMEKIIMLGTGNAGVIDIYNTCFVLKKDDEYVLVDAGGGNRILKQLALKDIALNQIHHVIVTHAHTDHILGVIWIYRMIATAINQNKYQDHLTIYCHDEVKQTLETMISMMLPKKLQKLLNERIFIQEVYDQETLDILGISTTFLDIASTKMKQFGFMMSLSQGRLVCLGDEPCAKHLESIVEGAYMMMHEAFCLYDERDVFKPYEKHHSTVKDASELAQRLHVKNLVLYHTEEKNMKNRKELYMKESQTYYHGQVFVPDDLEEIELL